MLNLGLMDKLIRMECVSAIRLPATAHGMTASSMSYFDLTVS